LQYVEKICYKQGISSAVINEFKAVINSKKTAPGIRTAMGQIESMWEQFDEIQKGIIPFLIHGNSPISIDALIVLSGAPAITVLNLLELLRKKKILCERRGYEKGLYFLVGTEFAKSVQKVMAEKDTERAIRTLIEYYGRSLDEGRERSLMLADLYQKLGNTEEGLHHIKGGADILFQSGEKEKAMVYYDLILKYFENKEPGPEAASAFLESVLVKLSASKELRPVHEHMALLNRAEEIAKRHKRWELLARIKLELASELLVAGQTGQAATTISDFHKLAEKVNDSTMLKMVALATSALHYWQGRIAETTRSYEEVIEDLEEFGNNELMLEIGTLVGWCYVMCGRIARGIGMIDAIRTKARLLGFVRTVYVADIMRVHALFEIRKISEAEAILDRSTAPQTHGNIFYHLVSWTELTCRAYVRCIKEDYEGALAYLGQADGDLPSLGWRPMLNTWTLDCLNTLESRGFVYENMDYQTEVEKLVTSGNLYLKGFALRHRALIKIEKPNPPDEILRDLKKSEKYLKKAGAEIELARTRVALGNYYLNKEDEKTARSYLEMAWQFFSAVDRSLFPSDLVSIMPKKEKMELMINRIGDITRSLGTIRDRSSFLDVALNVAMNLTMAMRGGFFAPESGNLRLIASRNVDPSYMATEAFKVVERIIADANQENREIIFPTTKGSNTVLKEAIQKTTITSLIAMPARLGEHVYGYLVLTNQLDVVSFPEDNLPFVRILCDQIAVGLCNINMYDEMKALKDRFEEEASFYRQELGITTPLEKIIGQSSAIHKMTEEIRQVAVTDSFVLILGETGVGKELVAKAIHGLSDRKDGPFIPVNLAAIPQDLAASELFGHEKGAFTSANERQKGRFELADGGTIFLDEIGDLSLGVQAKLLRVLQEGTFERLGGSTPIKSHFRVISATNKDLRTEVEKGSFRQDLYFRLNVFPIHIPPLRERRDDISLLAHFFVYKYGKSLGKMVKRIPPDELKKLLNYHWPGNVRELEHFIERALVLSDGHSISFTGFEYGLSDRVSIDDATKRLGTLAELEREHIEKVLKSTNWKVSGPHGAAAILGLKSSTLVFRMKKLGIKRS
jgi:transcriptional regulator with GAF, ATPase, and Fis domain